MRTSSESTVVSVVIPTVGRESVLEAVRSAQTQNGVQSEIIVVCDSPTVPPAVADIADLVDRIECTGGSWAQPCPQCGVAAASGEYVAFLDDDDEWLPTKLQLQVDEARSIEAAGHVPVVSSRIFQRKAGCLPCQRGRAAPGADRGRAAGGLPLREPARRVRATHAPDLDAADHPGVRGRAPVGRRPPPAQDWDWVVRTSAVSDVEVRQLAEPLPSTPSAAPTRRPRARTGAPRSSGRRGTANLGGRHPGRLPRLPDAPLRATGARLVGSSRHHCDDPRVRPAILRATVSALAGHGPPAPRREHPGRHGWLRRRKAAATRACRPQSWHEDPFRVAAADAVLRDGEGGGAAHARAAGTGAAVSATVVSGDIPEQARGLDIDALGGSAGARCAWVGRCRRCDSGSPDCPPTSTSSPAACGRPRRSGSPSPGPAGRSSPGSTRS